MGIRSIPPDKGVLYEQVTGVSSFSLLGPLLFAVVVLPSEIFLIPVGGITPANLKAYLADRVIGFGFGSALYTPSMTLDEIRRTGREFVSVWRTLQDKPHKDDK